jgi:hypothetical protein
MTGHAETIEVRRPGCRKSQVSLGKADTSCLKDRSDLLRSSIGRACGRGYVSFLRCYRFQMQREADGKRLWDLSVYTHISAAERSRGRLDRNAKASVCGYLWGQGFSLHPLTVTVSMFATGVFSVTALI